MGSAIAAADRLARIEARERILEDHLHAPAHARAARSRRARSTSWPSNRTVPACRLRPAAASSGRWSTCRSRFRRPAPASRRPAARMRRPRRHARVPLTRPSTPERMSKRVTRFATSSTGRSADGRRVDGVVRRRARARRSTDRRSGSAAGRAGPSSSRAAARRRAARACRGARRRCEDVAPSAPVSTASPFSMTTVRSAISATTPMSCVMNSDRHALLVLQQLDQLEDLRPGS